MDIITRKPISPAANVTRRRVTRPGTRAAFYAVRAEIRAAGDFTEWAEALAEFLLNHLETVLSADF